MPRLPLLLILPSSVWFQSPLRKDNGAYLFATFPSSLDSPVGLQSATSRRRWPVRTTNVRMLESPDSCDVDRQPAYNCVGVQHVIRISRRPLVASHHLIYQPEKPRDDRDFLVPCCRGAHSRASAPFKGEKRGFGEVADRESAVGRREKDQGGPPTQKTCTKADFIRNASTRHASRKPTSQPHTHLGPC